MTLKVQPNFSSSISKLQLGILLKDTRSPPSHLPCRCSVAHLFDNDSDTLWAFSFAAPLCISHVSEDTDYGKKIDLVIAYCCIFNGKPNAEKMSWIDDTKKRVYLAYCNIFSLRFAWKFILGTDVESSIEVAYLLEFMLWKIPSLQEFDCFRSVVIPKLSSQSLLPTFLSQRWWFQTYFSQST